MGWVRTRWTMTLAVAALVAASCGGGDGSSDATAEASGSDTTEAGSDGSDSPTEEPVAEDDATTDDQDPGRRAAVITIDGEATSYALDDVTYSPVEGVDDLTFETCDPDFFGSGRFYAIGYAVDDEGELILGDDGQPGTFTMDLPPDDWEATERDAPGFEITLGDIDIEIANPEEAAGGTMAWTIDDTTASGSAVFVDFENSYTVDFEVICEGERTVNVDDLPPPDDSGDNGGGFSLSGAGTGSYTVDGESFQGVDTYSCEVFSFGSQEPHPDDLSVLALLGGSEGLQVEISVSQGFDMTDGSQFDQVRMSVFHSRSGEGGLEQFEGGASNDANGVWSSGDQFDPDSLVELGEPPFVIDGDRITGALPGLEQTWPDEGAATVDVTFDLEIPAEINEDC